MPDKNNPCPEYKGRRGAKYNPIMPCLRCIYYNKDMWDGSWHCDY